MNLPARFLLLACMACEPASPRTRLLRPQLTPARAAAYSVAAHLARAGDLAAGLVKDDWSPHRGHTERPVLSFRVAEGGGTHRTIQAAIDAAVAHGGSRRVHVAVEPGVYHEVVCVPANAPPITLFGTSPNATDVQVVFDNHAGKRKRAGQPANPCSPNERAETFGTSGSATFSVNASGFHARNLTFANSVDESRAQGPVQGVALMTEGDRLVFENVRVLGNQDSLFVKTPAPGVVSRAYFRDCHVEGDVDFIFGRGTLVLDRCTIHLLSARNPQGVIVAPSTDGGNDRGILVIDSVFTAAPGTADGSIHLGRAWDEGQVDLATYTRNARGPRYPNGHALIRDSVLGPHIQRLAPWRAAATTKRPYSANDLEYPANRLFEFRNTGPGSVEGR